VDEAYDPYAVFVMLTPLFAIAFDFDFIRCVASGSSLP
jgi:hypothetical protein